MVLRITCFVFDRLQKWSSCLTRRYSSSSLRYHVYTMRLQLLITAAHNWVEYRNFEDRNLKNAWPRIPWLQLWKSYLSLSRQRQRRKCYATFYRRSYYNEDLRQQHFTFLLVEIDGMKAWSWTALESCTSGCILNYSVLIVLYEFIVNEGITYLYNCYYYCYYY